MEKLSPGIQKFVLFLMIAILIGGLTWVNYRFADQNPGGNDFIPRWIGTREFIYKGWSPYSQETTTKIQEFFYQRPATADEDWALFIYPHYSMVIFAPFAMLEDFSVVRALWMTTLEMVIMASVWVSFILTNHKPKPYLAAGLLFFWLIGYHGLRPIINGNASIIVSFFITLMLLAILKGWDRWAGAMLALSTIKPQMVILLVPLVLLWAISRKRNWILFSFLAAMIVLVGGSMLFQPDWIVDEIIQILQYPLYTDHGSPKDIFAGWWPGVGNQIGIMLSVIAAVILVLEWTFLWGKGYVRLFWTISLTLTLTNLIGVRTATANYTALIPATVLIFSAWEKRWGERVRYGVLTVLGVLAIGLWALFITTVEVGVDGQPMQAAIMFFPFPFVVFAGLYWVRWWVIRPRGAGEINLTETSYAE